MATLFIFEGVTLQTSHKDTSNMFIRDVDDNLLLPLLLPLNSNNFPSTGGKNTRRIKKFND